MNDLKELVLSFREAVQKAYGLDVFKNDFSFNAFPRGCCGDSCDLLGQYLLDNGIKTWYVCGMYYYHNKEKYCNPQSHAWLTTTNPIENEDYLIIDITGDQFIDRAEFDFYDESAFVGPTDHFHSLFQIDNVREVKSIDELGGFVAPRLNKLYSIIIEYMPSAKGKIHNIENV